MTAHSMRCSSVTSRLQRFQCGALWQPHDYNAFNAVLFDNLTITTLFNAVLFGNLTITTLSMRCFSATSRLQHFQCGALWQPRDYNTFNAVLFGNLTITALSMRCSLATSRPQHFQCGAFRQPRENVDKRCFIRFRPIAELARDKINSSKRLKERGVIAIIGGIF